MTSTLAPARPPGEAPGRRGLPDIPGPLDALKLAWRRLRRMSTALALLFALAAAAVLATFVPQEPVIAQTVAQWRAGADALGRPVGPGVTVSAFLDALGLFDVFGSWWFMTLTVALFVSLTGCLLPRYRAFAKVARRPPAAGRDLERLTSHQVLPTSARPEEALAVAVRLLRRRRFRRRILSGGDSPTGGPQLAAERGHAREGGSLVFHTAFYLLLVGIVVGRLFGFTGQVNVVEGRGFTDTRLSYDAAAPGRLFSLTDHSGFNLTLDDFDVDYHADFTPADFVSRVTVGGAGGTWTQDVRVNHPLTVDGMKVFQARFGLAPRVVVRLTETGQVLHDGQVMLSDAGQNQWTGVAKVPIGGAGTDGEAPPEMALDIALLPDADLADDGGALAPVSRSPRADNPVLFANVYVGDLGLSRPVAPTELRGEWDADEIIGDVVLAEGDTATIADGLFTVEFPELAMWSGFQVSHAPGRGILLAAAVLILAGLVPSLYAYRRRVWVTAREAAGGTEVVVAGVALQRAATFTEEFAGLVAALRQALPPAHPRPDDDPPREP